MNRFALVRLPTLSEAQSRVAEDQRTRVFRAGGIDLLDRMKEGLETPEQLVELRAITDAFAARMDGIRMSAEGWTVGALNTLTDVAEHPELPPAFRAVQQAARAAASPGIRNAATVGGNLLQRPRCWYYRHRDLVCLKKGGSVCYAADGRNQYHAILGGGPSYIVHPSSLGAPLLAADARVTIMGAAGEPRTIPISELFALPSKNPTVENTLAAGDVLLEVVLPTAADAAISAYASAKERKGYDWPLAEAAVRMDFDGETMTNVRIALGHVAPVPWDAVSAAKELEGKAPDPALFATAAAAAVDGARALSENGYKIPLVQALVRKALHEATEIPLPE